VTDIYATFICPAASVEAARAAAAAIEGGAGMLECELFTTGEATATHYVSSGWVRPAIHDALVPFCTITTGYHDVHDAIAAAGLSLIA